VKRHRIDVDDNVSMWAQTVDPVEPRPVLEGVVNADVAIVGAGFTGMSTAYEMRRRFPELGIVVLEARTVGNGASGRNGGMMLNWVNGIDSKDETLTKRIWATTQHGMDWITETIRTEDLRVRLRRDGCLETFTSQQRAEEAHRKAERLQKRDPRPAIEERYPNRQGYLESVKTAAHRLAGEGYLLESDIPSVLAGAGEKWDYLLEHRH